MNDACPVVGSEILELSVPIKVKPFAKVGNIKTKGCDKPIIKPSIDKYDGVLYDDCNFTITQKICIEVPIEFGCEIENEEAHIFVEAMSTERLCNGDCDDNDDDCDEEADKDKDKYDEDEDKEKDDDKDKEDQKDDKCKDNNDDEDDGETDDNNKDIDNSKKNGFSLWN